MSAVTFVTRVLAAAHVTRPARLVKPCRPCRGSGRVPMFDRSARDSYGWCAICPDCDGSGDSIEPTTIRMEDR